MGKYLGKDTLKKFCTLYLYKFLSKTVSFLAVIKAVSCGIYRLNRRTQREGRNK